MGIFDDALLRGVCRDRRGRRAWKLARARRALRAAFFSSLALAVAVPAEPPAGSAGPAASLAAAAAQSREARRRRGRSRSRSSAAHRVRRLARERAPPPRWRLPSAPLLAAAALGRRLGPAAAGRARRRARSAASAPRRPARRGQPSLPRALAEAGLLWMATVVALGSARRGPGAGARRGGRAADARPDRGQPQDRDGRSARRRSSARPPLRGSSREQDPAGEYRTLGESLFRGPRRSSPPQDSALRLDSGFSRRLVVAATRRSSGAAARCSTRTSTPAICRASRACARSRDSPPVSDAAAFFGNLALRWGMRFRGPGCRSPGYQPIRRRRPAGLGRARARVSRHPAARGWREARRVAVAALHAIPQLRRGEVVVESGGAARPRARPGAVRVVERTARAPGGRRRRARPGLALRSARLLAVPPVRSTGGRSRPCPRSSRSCAVPIPAGRHRVEWEERLPGLGAVRCGPVLFGMIALGLPCCSLATARTTHETRIAHRPGSLRVLLGAAGCRAQAASLRARARRTSGASARGVAARGAGPAAAGLRPHRHDVRRRASGRAPSSCATSSTARASRPRSSARRPERCNLLARLPGRTPRRRAAAAQPRRRGRRLPAVLEGGRRPSRARSSSGYLYGRGAYDMKSLGLAQALAMRERSSAGASCRRPTSSFSPRPTRRSARAGAPAGCSSTGRSGSAACAQVSNEGGTTEVILRDVRFWGLETVQAGLCARGVRGRLGSAARGARRRAGRSSRRLPSRRIRTSSRDSTCSPTTCRRPSRIRCGTSTASCENPAELAILPDRYGCFLEARIHWSRIVPASRAARIVSRRYVAVVSVSAGRGPERRSCGRSSKTPKQRGAARS